MLTALCEQSMKFVVCWLKAVTALAFFAANDFNFLSGYQLVEASQATYP